MFVTDEQEHDFEYRGYYDWDKLTSAKIEKDEDGDDFIFLFNNKKEEVGFIYAQLLGGRYGNMKISSLWIDFLNDAIHETNKQIKQDAYE